MAEKQGIPLTSIDGFPEDVANQLSELWITTAEEFVGAAFEEDGPQGLAELLNLPLDQVNTLVEQVQLVLPPDVSFAPGDIEIFGLGALDEPEDEEPDEGAFSFAPLPPSVDLRTRFPPIRNQKNRGTCVAFACTAVRESLLGPESTEEDLSEQFLYFECKQRDGYQGSGTWIRVGMAALQEAGVCTEVVWPYVPQPVQGNEGQGPPPVDAPENARQFQISSSSKLRARSVDQLRQVLANEQPIAFAVPVYTYWFTSPARTTGDIRMPLSTDRKQGGHAMCIVGYEDDPDVPGGGFFLVRNSWGTTWAGNNPVEPGHARLPYAYLSQYGSSAFTATAEVSPRDEDDQEKDGDDQEKEETFFDWLRRLLRRLFS